MTLSQVPDGLCNLAQRECSVDNRLDLACLQELAQYPQVIFARGCDQRTQLLTHKQREHLCPELAIDSSEPLSAPLSSHDHDRPLRGEGAPQVRQGGVPGDVEDDVVAVAGRRAAPPGGGTDGGGRPRPPPPRLCGAAHTPPPRPRAASVWSPR